MNVGSSLIPKDVTATRLVKDLLQDYDPRLLPVRKFGENVSIAVNIALRQLMRLVCTLYIIPSFTLCLYLLISPRQHWSLFDSIMKNKDCVYFTSESSCSFSSLEAFHAGGIIMSFFLFCFLTRRMKRTRLFLWIYGCVW